MICYTSEGYLTELICERKKFTVLTYAMDRAAVLRRRTELEREFAELQGQLDIWNHEAKTAPAAKRDRKKYTPVAVAKRGRREENQRASKARVEEALRRAPMEVKEEKFEQPKWRFQKRLLRLRDIRLTIPDGYPGSRDPVAIVREFEDTTVEVLLRQIGELGSIKAMLGMSCRMIKDSFKQEVTQDTVYEDKFDPTTDNIYFNCAMHIFTNADPDSVREWVVESFGKIIEDFERFVQNGSGWVIDSVVKLDMAIDRYNPGRGGSHMESPD